MKIEVSKESKAIFTPLLATYLLFSFITWELNPKNWEMLTRIVAILVNAAFTFIAVLTTKLED